MTSFQDLTVKQDSMQVYVFISADLFPGGEPRGEGPAFNSEACAVKNRHVWVVWAPEGAGKGSKVARWRRRGCNFGDDRGRVVSMSTGGGERFHPGENEEQEEGSYKSNELTGEKV